MRKSFEEFASEVYLRGGREKRKKRIRKSIAACLSPFVLCFAVFMGISLSISMTGANADNDGMGAENAPSSGEEANDSAGGYLYNSVRVERYRNGERQASFAGAADEARRIYVLLENNRVDFVEIGEFDDGKAEGAEEYYVVSFYISGGGAETYALVIDAENSVSEGWEGLLRALWGAIEDSSGSLGG